MLRNLRESKRSEPFLAIGSGGVDVVAAHSPHCILHTLHYSIGSWLLVILSLTHAFMGLFLVVELECSSLLAWAVVATCSRCSIFLMLHNTRTRYTLHKLLCDSVPELVVTSLYVHDGVNIFQILHGSPGHLWEHKHSVCFTQI